MSLLNPKHAAAGNTQEQTCRTFVFEIGTEELPAFALHDATLQLETLVAEKLAKVLTYESLNVYSTPRRLIVCVKGMPVYTQAYTEEFPGPAVRIAFDETGAPTKAAIGFARGKGLEAKDLVVKEKNGENYVYAIRHVEAKSVVAMLPTLCKELLVQISWPKSQRWGDHSEQFSRPVRWLLALFGTDIVPFDYAGLTSGRTTYGHRFLAPAPIELAQADDLIAALREAYIVPTEAEREALIRKQALAEADKLGLVPDFPAKTMAEVVNLCEYPTVMVGTFSESFLAVPKEITVDAMLVHQRYFPLFHADGSLSNKFIITSNGDPKFEANIIDGNQRVVAARLYDAKFFYDEDLKRPLEDYVERLNEVVFQEALGTTLAKTKRISALASDLAIEAGLNALDVADAKRAAFLCKADLVTGAVVEFTSVQGIMGSYYAAAAGETPQVAQAIADHYRPRFAGDDLPASKVGCVVAFADKLDTICGLFAVGQAPTGSSDPFALRRSAIGILAIIDAGLNVSLVGAIDAALSLYEADGLKFDRKDIRKQVIDFFITRTKVALKDKGCEVDAIDAVMAVCVEEPFVFTARVHALEEARKNNREVFDDLATAYARANNLKDASVGVDYDETLFCAAEKSLSQAVEEASGKVETLLAQGDYAASLAVLAGLRGPIDTFFADVMVMDKDIALRTNHLKLLNRFVQVFAHIADFGKMAKTTK